MGALIITHPAIWWRQVSPWWHMPGDECEVKLPWKVYLSTKSTCNKPIINSLLSIYPPILPFILSICLSIYLPIHLQYSSTCLFSYLSIHLFVYLFVNLSINKTICLWSYISICPSVYPSIQLSIFLSIYLSCIYLPIYPFCLSVYICLSNYLFVYLFIHLHLKTSDEKKVSLRFFRFFYLNEHFYQAPTFRFSIFFNGNVKDISQLLNASISKTSNVIFTGAW